MSSTSQRRILIALYNMGGPSQTRDVRSFLQALFADNDLLGVPFPGLLQNFIANKIVAKRVHEVEERYNLIGGGSPQLRITNELCQHLKNKLPALPGFSVVDIVPLMRYTKPDVHDLMSRIAADHIDEIWLYSQYPHCSRATTGSSLRDLGLALNQHPDQAKLAVRSFLPTAFVPAFVDLWVSRLREAWSEMATTNKHLLVSAHSLPQSYIAQGDPYADQIVRFALDVLRRVGLSKDRNWTMCWQSAVGPAKWLRPSTPDALRMLRSRGVENVLVWPISFVSDHIETSYELDIEYGALASELGFQSYTRVRNLNTDADYIEVSVNLFTAAAKALHAGQASALLRCLRTEAVAEGCALQTGGCLCARYFHAGLRREHTGVPWNR